MRDSTDNRLDPVRLRPPRPRSLLRYAVIAALLALAAGVLFLEPRAGTAECSANPGGRRTATPSGSPAERRTASLPVPPGYVGVPVQLAEPATAAVLRPGDRVDVVARTAKAVTGTPDPAASGGAPAGRPGTRTVVLARDALVLAVNAGQDGSPDAGVVYLAVTKERAEEVATVAPEVAIGVTVRPG